MGTLQAWLDNRAALLAGQTDVTPQDGITSGPGNQGTANTAMMLGQAGTAAEQISTPRAQHFGTGGTAQGSTPAP